MIRIIIATTWNNISFVEKHVVTSPSSKMCVPLFFKLYPAPLPHTFAYPRSH